MTAASDTSIQKPDIIITITATSELIFLEISQSGIIKIIKKKIKLNSADDSTNPAVAISTANIPPVYLYEISFSPS